MLFTHRLSAEWKLSDYNEGVIFLNPLFNYIKRNNLQPELISIKDIAYKDLNQIITNSSRQERADAAIPGIVSKGMENPYNKPYRMIDGRHRMLKLIETNNITEYKCFVIPKDTIMSFFISFT